MTKKILKALEMKINEAYKEKGECLIDLEMKKKIIDNQYDDILMITFPTDFDKKWIGEDNVYYTVKEYSEDTFRKFHTLEDVAKWINKVYY